MRDNFTIAWAYFITAVFHINVFSCEILRVLLVIPKYQKNFKMKGLVSFQTYFVQPLVDWMVAMSILYLFYYQGMTNEKIRLNRAKYIKRQQRARETRVISSGASDDVKSNFSRAISVRLSAGMSKYVKKINQNIIPIESAYMRDDDDVFEKDDELIPEATALYQRLDKTETVIRMVGNRYTAIRITSVLPHSSSHP